MKTYILKLSSVFLCATLLIVSCKKKDTTEPSTPGTGGVTTSGTNPNGVYGNLQTGYYDYEDNLGVVTKDSLSIASFYQDAMSSVSPVEIYAGTVTVNGINLDYTSPQNYYIENTHSSNMTTLVWAASGSGTVTPFSYTYTPVYPKITGPIVLQDTCHKSSGISISLSGINNSSGGGTSVYLYEGSHTASKTFFGTSGTVNFTPTDLSSFSVNNPLTIMVLLANANPISVGSVKYQFTSTYTYTKFSYLKL
jgi:hypothetical protein